MNKAIFFDRDGILTKEKNPPKSSKQIHINEDIIKVLPILKDMGYLLFCVSNQPDISRGLKTKEEVQEVNDILWTIFPEIIKFSYCWHDDEDYCYCRKPLPGMIIAIAVEYEIIIKNSWMIGDTWRDIGAGNNAGCKTILVGNMDNEYYNPDYKVKNIKDIIEIIKRSQLD